MSVVGESISCHYADLFTWVSQESFASFTRSVQTQDRDEIVEWRPVYEAWSADRDWEAALNASVTTEDRGLVQDLSSASWIELDVDTRGEQLEERWELVSASRTEQSASLLDLDKNVIVVRVGDHFAYFIASGEGLPDWQTEFGHGLIRNGSGVWEITVSTLPHREGEALPVELSAQMAEQVGQTRIVSSKSTIEYNHT